MSQLEQKKTTKKNAIEPIIATESAAAWAKTRLRAITPRVSRHLKYRSGAQTPPHSHTDQHRSASNSLSLHLTQVQSYLRRTTSDAFPSESDSGSDSDGLHSDHELGNEHEHTPTRPTQVHVSHVRRLRRPDATEAATMAAVALPKPHPRILQATDSKHHHTSSQDRYGKYTLHRSLSDSNFRTISRTTVSFATPAKVGSVDENEVGSVGSVGSMASSLDSGTSDEFHDEIVNSQSQSMALPPRPRVFAAASAAAKNIVSPSNRLRDVSAARISLNARSQSLANSCESPFGTNLPRSTSMRAHVPRLSSKGSKTQSRHVTTVRRQTATDFQHVLASSSPDRSSPPPTSDSRYDPLSHELPSSTEPKPDSSIYSNPDLIYRFVRSVVGDCAELVPSLVHAIDPTAPRELQNPRPEFRIGQAIPLSPGPYIPPEQGVASELVDTVPDIALEDIVNRCLLHALRLKLERCIPFAEQAGLLQPHELQNRSESQCDLVLRQSHVLSMNARGNLASQREATSAWIYHWEIDHSEEEEAEELEYIEDVIECMFVCQWKLARINSSRPASESSTPLKMTPVNGHVMHTHGNHSHGDRRGSSPVRKLSSSSSDSGSRAFKFNYTLSSDNSSEDEKSEKSAIVSPLWIDRTCADTAVISRALFSSTTEGTGHSKDAPVCVLLMNNMLQHHEPHLWRVLRCRNHVRDLEIELAIWHLCSALVACGPSSFALEVSWEHRYKARLFHLQHLLRLPQSDIPCCVRTLIRCSTVQLLNTSCNGNACMPVDNFHLMAPFARGAFGEVFLAHDLEQDSPCVVKVVDPGTSYALAQQVQNEVHILHRIPPNPHIINMRTHFFGDHKACVVLEFCPGGDLASLLHHFGALQSHVVAQLSAEVIAALEFLHWECNIVHTDVKPANVMIGADGHLKLIDFGLAVAVRPTACDHDMSRRTRNSPASLDHEFFRYDSPTAKVVRGTVDYIAPEVLLSLAPSYSADFWSLGVMIFEMLTGVPPFHADTEEEVCHNIMDSSLRALLLQQPLPDESQSDKFPDLQRQLAAAAADLAPEALELLQLLLNPNPLHRIGSRKSNIKHIKNLPFFSGIDWDTLKTSAPVFVPDLSGPYDLRYCLSPSYQEVDDNAAAAQLMGHGTSALQSESDSDAAMRMKLSKDPSFLPSIARR
jgi:serine/threonine protein kinase